MMTDERICDLISVYQQGLLDDTLPFWTRHAVDHVHAGYMTSLDRDGTVIDTDKSTWQQGRFAWLLGELYNTVEPREEWLQLASSGITFLDRHCFDSQDGRMWFLVTRDGKPLRKRRYAYSESFAAIAYGEYAKATGSEEYADKARNCFQAFIDHSLDPQGVEPKFTSTRPTKNVGFPMITIHTAQQLRDSIELADADVWIDRSIDAIRRDFLKPDFGAVMETVGLDGKIIDHFDGRTLNPGHAIEGAWFTMWEGKIRGDADLMRTGCQMLDWMWERGWDEEFGGILYFVDLMGKPVQEYWHDMKFWWPQNEAIIATLLAYSLTGDEKYARWHRLVHEWAYRHFADATYGEWYGYLRRDGTPTHQAKGTMWKGPFHLPRMQLTCWQILAELQTTESSHPLAFLSARD